MTKRYEGYENWMTSTMSEELSVEAERVSLLLEKDYLCAKVSYELSSERLCDFLARFPATVSGEANRLLPVVVIEFTDQGRFNLNKWWAESITPKP